MTEDENDGCLMLILSLLITAIGLLIYLIIKII